MKQIMFIFTLLIVCSIGAINFLDPETIIQSNCTYENRNRIIDDIDYDGDLDYIIRDANGPVWVEDTDGDGVPDTNHDIGNFSYWLESIEFVDMNNDGFKDIAVTVYVDENFYIFVNDGSGNFTLETYYATDYKSDNALYYDFNNDGIKDAYFSGWGRTIFLTRSSVNDTFRVDVLSGIVHGHRRGAFNDYSYLVDFNNDGYMDVVGVNDSFSNLLWYEFDPTADTFVNCNVISNYDPYNQFVVADADNDNDQDVFLYESGLQTLSLLENDQNHDFTQRTVIADSLVNLKHLLVGDMNGDGMVDIVLHHGFNHLKIFLNTGNGFAFSEEIEIPVTGVFIEDVNDDGASDIVAEINRDDFLYFYNNNGSFGFDNCKLDGLSLVYDVRYLDDGINPELIIKGANYLVKAELISGEWVVDDVPLVCKGYIFSYDVEDIDNNGILDFVISEDYAEDNEVNPEHCRLLIYMNNQLDTVLNLPYSRYSTINRLDFIDIDNDGDFDLKCHVNEDFQRSIKIYENNNGFTDNAHVVLNSITSWHVFDDVDGDLDKDLIFSDGNQDLYISYNNGNFNFSDPTLIMNGYFSRFIYEDITDDGIKDIIKYSTYQDSIIAVYAGNTSNGFSTVPMVFGYAGSTQTMRISDLDLDGDKDLVYSIETGYECMAIHSLENEGVMSNWNDVPATEEDSDYCFDFKLIDINDDGLQDIVYYGIKGKKINVMINNSVVFPNSDTDIPEYKTQLLGNYPNPFNPETKISYSMANSGNAELTIYNIKGQRVKTLVNDHVESGEHSTIWNGKDDKDSDVSSGVYFYRLKTAEGVQNRKMLLLK